MMTTWLQDLNVRLPILQAPMAGAQGSALALAVSGAGALGALPAAMLTLDALRAELQRLRAKGMPYNANFFAHTPPPADAQLDAAWQARLAPYYAELDLDPAAPVPSANRQPFDAATAALVEEFAPPVVSFHFGLPAAELLARVKRSGARVLASATTVAEARWLEAHGVDAIIAQGLEAGGHRGHFLTRDLSEQMGTFTLLPQVVAAVRCPVVAAGGIADAAGVRAARALGASAVQVGTAFLCADEANTSAAHRAVLQSEAAQHTALTNLFSGGVARGIMNRAMRELGPLNPTVPPFPRGGSALAPLRSAAEACGSTDFTPLWSGQNASACLSAPAAQILAALAVGL